MVIVTPCRYDFLCNFSIGLLELKRVAERIALSSMVFANILWAENRRLISVR